MTTLDLAVGQIVELNDGRVAILQFKGTTAFAPGEWIGIVLDEPTGKNDGSVKGDRYFDCEPNHGMFLRATGISKIIQDVSSPVKPAAKPAISGTTTGRGRPSTMGLGAKSVVSQSSRRESVAASPTPARGASSKSGSLRTPTASPTKQSTSVSTKTSTTAAPNGRAISSSTARARASLAPAAATAGRRTSTLAPAVSAGRPSARSSMGVPAPRGGPAATKAPGRTTPSLRQSFAPQRPPSSHRGSIGGDGIQEDESEAANERSTTLSHASEQPVSEVASSIAESDAGPDEDAEDVEQTPKPVKQAAPARAKPHSPQQARTQRDGSPSAPQTASRVAPPRHNATQSREIEDLQTKLRMMEKRRLEDREKLKTLDRVQQERDRFESIITKLQTKYQPQQQEIADLKRQLKESETSLVDIEGIQAEHDAELENAALDREMAEEQYEVLKSEVGALREKNEELELELEILKEENQELGKEMSPEEKTSQGWLQLERSNERLREALLRLRDVTQEQEAELREQIKTMEKEAEGFGAVRDDASGLKEKLLESEAAVDDLKQQLEVAQGGEDMIEELSERNMTLQEQAEELKATIDDLESLRELNDELEANHVETEKQMQEEIDFKDTIINEQARRAGDQQKTVDDYEMTVRRFREAFRSLQADLEDMRASQQISETEAEELNSKSRALIDLNMKLQSSATKTQVKAIDLQLKRLDAEEAAQHLAIVQLFLPNAFQADRDSILALLRFKRIGFKASLIHSMIKELVATGAQGYNLFAACSVLDRLAWISAMSEEFTSNISACEVSDFVKYEGALYELEPVERAMNAYIDGLRKDELDVRRVDEELQRTMSVMSHLSTVHIRQTLASSADNMVMKTSTMQSHLENTANALALCRTHVEKNAAHKADQVNGKVDHDDEESSESAFTPFFERIDALISYARGAKVQAGKAQRELTELRTRSLALEISHLSAFVEAESQASQIAAYAREVGDRLTGLTNSDDETKTLLPNLVVPALKDAATKVFALSEPEREPFSTVRDSIQSLSEQLSHLCSLTTDLSNTSEFEPRPAPWTIRATTIKNASTTSAATEAELTHLHSKLQDRTLLIRTKERELDESALRIETLEARMKESGRHSVRADDLETQLHTLQSTHKETQSAHEQISKDVTRLRAERDDLRLRLRGFEDRDKAGLDVSKVVGGASRLELDRAALRVKNLEQTVRFLSSSTKVSEDKEWLTTPLVPETTPAQERKKRLRAEAGACLGQLLDVAGMEGVRLSAIETGERLKWRPVRETGMWVSGRRREEWETWRAWGTDVTKRMSSGGRRLNKKVEVGEVRIVGEDEV